MRKLITFVALTLLAASCTPSSNYNTGVPSKPLMPLTAGNQWIYVDSIFDQNNGGALISTYLDTMIVNNNTAQYNSQGGVVPFYGITDPNGWFGDSSYIGLDPQNIALYGLDSLNSQPFEFFGTATADGTILGQSYDNSNPSCTLQYTLVGYSTTVSMYSHTCLQNVQTTVNCNNYTVDQINTYLTPGVGIVRLVEHQADSTGANLNRSFSMTLQSYTVQ